MDTPALETETADLVRSEMASIRFAERSADERPSIVSGG
jgi:hypothetical protein